MPQSYFNAFMSALGHPNPELHTGLHLEANRSRTGHYGYLGNPLYNERSKIKSKHDLRKKKTYPRKPPDTTSKYASTPRGGQLTTRTFINPKKPTASDAINLAKKYIASNYSMPYRRRKLMGRRRKRFVRRRKLQSLWPASQVVKMSLVQTASYDATTGAMGGVVMKANSLNDPTGVAGANLPLGLDQWAALYSKYKILASKISVLAHPTSITGAGTIGVHLTDDSSLLTNLDHYRELPLTTARVVSPDIDVAKCGMTYKAKKFWHLAQIRDNDQLSGTFSTSPGDPSDIAYFHVWLQDNNLTQTLTCEITVRFDFIVLLTDRIMPARSSL